MVTWSQAGATTIEAVTIGSFARVLLGKSFPAVGRFYRSLFVDLSKLVAALPVIPPRARILDVGGGDGEVVNELLARYPEAQVTMLDVSRAVGGALRPEFRDRVRVLPGMSLRAYAERNPEPPDLVVITDVIHHIAPSERNGFFADLRALVGASAVTIFIKDVEPGYLRAWLSYLSDRFITGDRNVSLVSQTELRRLVLDVFPDYEVEETPLMQTDRPNYALVFRPAASRPR